MTTRGRQLGAAVILLGALAAGGCGEEPAGKGAKAGAKAERAAIPAPGEGEAASKVALEDLEKRARAALSTSDLGEAKRLVEQGIGLTENGSAELEAARGRLVLVRGNAAAAEGRIVDARRDYADAMALFRVRSDDRGRFEVFLAEAALEEGQGDYAAAERQLEEAESLLAAISDEGLRGAYQRRLGRLAFVRARFADACTMYQESIKAFGAARDDREQAETLLLLAAAEDGRGDAPAARRALDKAMSAFVKLGDKGGEVRALHRLASFALRDGQSKKARAMLTKVKALYEELGREGDAVKVGQQLAALPEGSE